MTPARLSPPFWRRDAYVLGKLARHVANIAEEIHQGSSIGSLVHGDVVVDLGAGSAPYRSLFERPEIRYIECDLHDGAEVVIRSGSPVSLGDHSAKIVVS